MMQQSKKMTKGILTGMIIGSVLGTAAAIMLHRPQQSQFQKTMHRTFCTLSTVMQSLSDLTR